MVLPPRRTQVVGVLFDWDGVLLDSLGASFNVYNKIFVSMGSHPLTKDQFLELQSPNWYEFYEKVGLPSSQWKRVDEEWMRLYQEESPGLHQDALRCLRSLRASGFKLALVSNGSRVRVERELEETGVRAEFDSVLCGEKREELKPSPVMIERTIGALRIAPKRAIYVGDAPADVQASKSAGVPAIAIARGPVQEARLRLENPDLVFHGLDEMTSYLVA